MKKGIIFCLILAVVIILAIGGIFYYSKSKEASLQWQTFTIDPGKTYAPRYGINFTGNGFTFNYPAGWTIGYDNPAVILSLYDATATADLAECYARRAAPASSSAAEINPPIGECSSLNPSIDVFPSQYVDYPNLNTALQSNYPNYQKLNINGVDVFRYDENSDPASVVYHVNFPDQKTGIEFEYENDAITPADYPTMLPLIVQSVRFAQ